MDFFLYLRSRGRLYQCDGCYQLEGFQHKVWFAAHLNYEGRGGPANTGVYQKVHSIPVQLPSEESNLAPARAHIESDWRVYYRYTTRD